MRDDDETAIQRGVPYGDEASFSNCNADQVGSMVIHPGNPDEVYPLVGQGDRGMSED